MTTSYNENLLRTIELTEQMLELAEKGDQDRSDASCGAVYGILRQAAQEIKQLAEHECEQHQHSGKWEEKEASPR